MKTDSVATRRPDLPRATFGETLGVIADVIVPTVAKGTIIRRPAMVALAERLDLDRRAIRRMQKLQAAYVTGPLLLRIPGRSQAVILAPEHVHRVLEDSPEPFATASSEKRAALAHFEPRGVLISHGPDRADRRRFNEAALDTDRPTHRLGERFVQVLHEEAGLLLDEAHRAGALTWDTFTAAWFRVVRRVVLGDGARNDDALTAMLADLRSDANWAFLKPRRTRRRRQFYERLHHHLARAEPGSLAAMMARIPATVQTAPIQQVPQWLFAFDAAGIATFRALALLATHPDHAEQAQHEIREADEAAPHDLPYLRACVLEALRLWPTTPMVLRESTKDTIWEAGNMPARTSILIFAQFFHRDDRRLPYAHRFSPELWLQDRGTADWPLIPFSGGPAICPGRYLVLLLVSTLLAALLETHHLQLLPPTRLSARRPLPATLNHFALRFALTRRGADVPRP